jgi:hypothetical protein
MLIKRKLCMTVSWMVLFKIYELGHATCSYDSMRMHENSNFFGDSQKDLAQNILLSKAVQPFIKNSKRFTEGT